MKILLSGSTGFVGTALQKFLKDKGHSMVRLVRDQQEQSQDTILWDPENFSIDGFGCCEGFDAVVHLSGENIAKGKWNAALKQRISDSRVKSTQFLSQILSKLQQPPKVLISASAVGFYGDRGDEICNEKLKRGNGYLAEVCEKWEEATSPAKSAGIRTANLRFGVVLSPKGGALAKMLTPFKLGMGGVLGTGNQYMSWVSIDDAIAIILYVIDHFSLSGPINCVAPNPVTNREWTKTLGKALHRPTIFSVPTVVLRFLLGEEMANELLLSSVRAMPSRLLEAGYPFVYPDLTGYFSKNLH